MADIDVNHLSEVINDKMDRDAHNVQSPSAVVIAKQDPAEGNNWTWYRLYSDGWVEQGGCFNAPSDAAYILTLPVRMDNSTYTVMITRDAGLSEYGTSNINARWQIVYNKTETTFTTWGVYGGRAGVMWQVSGKSKQS